MIYCWQFKKYRKRLEKFEKNPLAYVGEIEKCYAEAQKLTKLRYLYKKGRVFLYRETKFRG